MLYLPILRAFYALTEYVCMGLSYLPFIVLCIGFYGACKGLYWHVTDYLKRNR